MTVYVSCQYKLAAVSHNPMVVGYLNVEHRPDIHGDSGWISS